MKRSSRTPPAATSTSSSSDRASAVRSRPTASPRPAAGAGARAGQAYPPGSFPRRAEGRRRQLLGPERRAGYGMFDIWSFRGIDAVVSSGLGGGSLIYANVLLRKDEHWFRQDRARRPGPGGDLAASPEPTSIPTTTASSACCAPRRLPFADARLRTSTRPRPLRDAAAGLDRGLGPRAARRAVPQRRPAAVPEQALEPEPYGNLHGLPRRTCSLCGECDIGCNSGAKNTLDHTYLSAAAHAGAIISPLSEVRTIRRLDRGFEVTYELHRPGEVGAEGGPPDPDGHGRSGRSSAPARSGAPSCCCRTGRRCRA